ncbi:MAG: SIS domain-containing protein, partial [Methanomethylophilus sp.]|nr:SIS domain-containing protein [Methanomethylophilus sp.]
MMFKTDSLNQMAREIGGLESDLTAALDIPSGITKSYKHIMICGMGASAIGGALFVDSMYYTSKVSVEVVKTMNLPAWVDGDTLFVACSYSGNTYETVQMYKEAIAKGIDVIAVTHGGQLEELSKQNGNLMMKIGGELIQPRSAIGWFIGLLGGIIEDAGGPNVREQLKALLPRILEYK